MSLHTLPISAIKYEDVLSFCEAQHPESEILDYKQDWPEHLDRSIAALANTQGGLILLGVAEEDKTGRPQSPFLGIDLGRGADEIKRRIMSTAYDAIYPPLFPEIAVVPLPDSAKAIAVIRVQQSHQTPHATDQRQRIYVRVGSQNRFEENLATLQQLSWLWERHKQSVELREQLLIQAREIATNVEQTLNLDSSKPSVILEMHTIPYFPTLPMLEGHELYGFFREKVASSGYGNGSDSFPTLRNPTSRPVLNGVLRFDAVHGWSSVAYANYWGMIYGRRQIISREERYERIEPPYIFVGDILCHLDAFLSYLHPFYERFTLLDSGLYQLVVKLHVTQNLQIVFGMGEREHLKHYVYTSELPLFSIVETPRGLISLNSETFLSIAQNLHWAVGYSWDKDNLLAKLKTGRFRNLP